MKVEYSQSYSKLLYLENLSNDYIKVIIASIAAIAAFAAVIMKDGKIANPTLFVSILSLGTIISGLFLIMTLYNTIQCYRVGGYIRFLEEKINEIVDEKLLIWESKFAHQNIHRSATSIMIIITICFLFL